MAGIATEFWGVQHLAALTGYRLANVRDAKSAFGPDERGLDLVFEFDGRRIGAQHTVFHQDEGQTAGRRGSLARAHEEATARATRAPFGMWGRLDFRPALLRRIDEKIAIAARHDLRGVVAETWLVVSASLNRWGAAASTYIHPSCGQAEELNRLVHDRLEGSRFARAFLILHINLVVYGWTRAEGWRLIADPDARERERHRLQMNDLIFNRIPVYHRLRG